VELYMDFFTLGLSTQLIYPASWGSRNVVRQGNLRSVRSWPYWPARRDRANLVGGAVWSGGEFLLGGDSTTEAFASFGSGLKIEFSFTSEPVNQRFWACRVSFLGRGPGLVT
jgi:hypothetical protein